MPRIDTWLECDLQHPVQVKVLNGYVFSQDNMANKIGVIVTDNGEPVTLTGTVYGYIIRSDNHTIEVAGSIENTNRAYFIMPQEGYLVGNVSIVIKVINASQITTLAACTSYVYESRTGQEYVPTGTPIPDLSTLQEAINNANTAASAANTAATNANAIAQTVVAAEFSSSNAYAVGQYVMKSGTLYRFTSAHTAGNAWSSSEVTAVKLANDTSDLKSAFGRSTDKYIEKGTETITEFKQGTLASSTNLKRCNSGFFHCYVGDVIKVTGIASGQKFRVENTLGVVYDWQSADFSWLVLAETDYGIVAATTSGDDAIAPSDISATVNINDGSSIINALSVAWAETENRYVPNFKATKTGATNTAYYSISDGVISFTGGTGGNGVYIISKVITLEAGKYYFGSYTALSSSKCGLQLRFWENNADAGDVGVGTVYTYGSFTINEQKTVVVRLRTLGTNSLNGVIIKPYIIKNTYPEMFIPNRTAIDYSARFDLLNVWNTKWTNLTDGTTGDADTLLDTGLFRGGSTGTYTHLPESASGKNFILATIGQKGSLTYKRHLLIIFGTTYEVWTRERYGGTPTWHDWSKLYDSTVMEDKSDNNIVKYTTDTFTGTTPNVGTKLRIMSYNVAKYNNDTETYISDAKRFNFKKMLSKLNPDFIGVQEARTYIDGDNGTKAAMEYIYKPVYPFIRGANNYELISKYEATNGGLVRLTDDNVVNRELRWGTYAVGNKVLLFCTVHPIARHNGDISEPSDSPASIADRKVEYTKTMQWVCGDIDLAYYNSGYDSSRRIYAPAHDYCIITGDMNSATDDDKANLTEQVSAKNFTMANGGWLGWLWTNRDKAGTTFMALDNIICSPNIIINNVTAYQSMYNDLYSDHVPFVADVVLT